MSLDFSTVVYACQVSIPSAVVAGFLGYQLGKIFENPKASPSKQSKKAKNTDLLIDDLLLDDINKVFESGKDKPVEEAK